MTNTSCPSMSALYEKAWHKLFETKPIGMQKVIIKEPHGREANDLAHEVVKLAEKWDYENKVEAGEQHWDDNSPF